MVGVAIFVACALRVRYVCVCVNGRLTLPCRMSGSVSGFASVSVPDFVSAIAALTPAATVPAFTTTFATAFLIDAVFRRSGVPVRRSSRHPRSTARLETRLALVIRLSCCMFVHQFLIALRFHPLRLFGCPVA
jgi:hypothetical protein